MRPAVISTEISRSRKFKTQTVKKHALFSIAQFFLPFFALLSHLISQSKSHCFVTRHIKCHILTGDVSIKGIKINFQTYSKDWNKRTVWNKHTGGKILKKQ